MVSKTTRNMATTVVFYPLSSVLCPLPFALYISLLVYLHHYIIEIEFWLVRVSLAMLLSDRIVFEIHYKVNDMCIQFESANSQCLAEIYTDLQEVHEIITICHNLKWHSVTLTEVPTRVSHGSTTRNTTTTILVVVEQDDTRFKLIEIFTT